MHSIEKFNLMIYIEIIQVSAMQFLENQADSNLVISRHEHY